MCRFVPGKNFQFPISEDLAKIIEVKAKLEEERAAGSVASKEEVKESVEEEVKESVVEEAKIPDEMPVVSAELEKNEEV